MDRQLCFRAFDWHLPSEHTMRIRYVHVDNQLQLHIKNDENASQQHI